MLGRYKREMSVAGAYVLLLLVLAVRAPTFFTGPKAGVGEAVMHVDKFSSTLVSAAPVLVAAVGMTLVILARHIDISIGSQLSIGAVFAGLLVQAGLPMPLAALATIAFGAVMGALNGALVAGLGLPSIVVTLATMVGLREGLRWWRGGVFVMGLPPGFQWFGVGQAAGQRAIVLTALVVFAVVALGLRHVAAGRAVYAVGSDPEAARLVGIRPRRVVFGVFVLMGMLTALAALLSAVRSPQVDPSEGVGLELQVIAAVVVGGVAISGGRGTLVGPLFGVILLTTIGPALVFLGTQPHWEKAIQGAIILLAVASDAKVIKKRVTQPAAA